MLRRLLVTFFQNSFYLPGEEWLNDALRPGPPDSIRLMPRVNA